MRMQKTHKKRKKRIDLGDLVTFHYLDGPLSVDIGIVFEKVWFRGLSCFYVWWAADNHIDRIDEDWLKLNRVEHFLDEFEKKKQDNEA